MIGRLSGKLIEKNPPSLMLDVNGVGYEIDAPMSTFYKLPAIGADVGLFTHLLVREDAQLLYAFATASERSVFRLLLKVNGVGAKVALAIQSGLSAEELVNCVANKDVAALVRIPGIGKKTAERVLLDLKDKLDAFAGNEANPVSTSGGESVRTQAEEALASLGYKPAEAKRLLDKCAGDAQTVEELIRAALRGASELK